jgi:phosphoglucosamine mutase
MTKHINNDIYRNIMKFGTDGVRGKAGEVITPFVATRLAMAVGIYFRKHSKTNKILVGKDTRRSGYMIENAIVSGLTAVGFDVEQIGPMPTPAIAFLTEDMRCDAGIMISASHNPYYDNGVKFFKANGDKLDTKAEKEIEKIYHNDEIINNSFVTGKNIGSSKRIVDVIGRYIVHIKNSFPKDLLLKDYRIVVDTANGAGYIVAPTVLKELGADVVVINNTPNGFNINENCGAMHTSSLAEEVLKARADIGLALDGDADRLVVVDENGNQIDGDKLIGALAVYLKEENKLTKNRVVTTVMSNQALEDYLAKHSIELLRSNVGDKHVLDLMQKDSINFGGEESGHIIFSDNAKTGDGLLSALQVVALIAKKEKSASQALNAFELYPQVKENIKVSSKPELQDIKGLDKILQKIEKDGIRHLIRYSGTENKLRLLLEGKDDKLLNSYLEELIEFFKKAI